jgi:hypothetical protein
VKIYNSSFERVEEFKFWGTLTNQNSIQEKNHSTLQSGNACCHLVKNLLSSILLHKTINIKILRTVILSIVLHGYENWSLTLEEEHMLSVFQSKVVRSIFGPKRDEVKGEWREIYNEKLNDVHLTKYNLGDEIKKNKMGVVLVGTGERCIQGLGGET